MTGIKAALLTSTTGITGLAVVDPITAGEALAKGGATVVLGAVAVACVVGMMRLYRDKDKQAELLYELIRSGIASNTRAADLMLANGTLMVEVKDALLKCKAMQDSKAHAQIAPK